MGRRLREPVQRDRPTRARAARSHRSAVQGGEHRDDPWDRISPRSGWCALSRVPVRWRLTLAFALVMAVVLAATGIFIRERLASNLDQAVERALRARAADVAALAQQSDSGLIDARG